MVRTGTTSTWLSAAITAALALAFFVPCLASTDVYLVRPQANTHNNSYNYVSQSFVATCDSVPKIAFFLGQKSGSSNYQMEIDSTGIAKGGVLTLSANGALAYAENEGTYGTPVPVKRGYTYTLKFSRYTPSEKVDFYYVADTLAYPWGNITYPGTVIGDLCARVIGTGKVLDQWGMNLFGEGLDTTELTNCGSRLVESGVHRAREQVPLGLSPLGGGANLPTVWTDTLLPCAHWDTLDMVVDKMAAQGVEVMLNPFGSSYKAACIDTFGRNGHRWVWDPTVGSWAMLYPPKYLNKPVVIDSAGGKKVVNPQNFWARFLYELVRRYGPKGTARNGDSTGTFWANRSYYVPVRFWEVDNEVNNRVTWTYPQLDSVFPNLDYNSVDEYNQFMSGPAGRQAYWMNIYVRQCKVADSVMHYMLYPDNRQDSVKILTNSTSIVNYYTNGYEEKALGKTWLRKFYEMGGKPYSNGITYHAYQELSPPPGYSPLHKFVPRLFQADYDTVRSIMAANGDAGMCWPDEQGWGTTPSESLTGMGLWVTPNKQADCMAQMYTVGASYGASPRGPMGWVGLYQLRDYLPPNSNTMWFNQSGVVYISGITNTTMPAFYAYKQANTKIKDKYFNRQVPIGNPSDSVYCFEFQAPGTDANRKTWVIWKPKKDDAKRESLSVRTNNVYSDSISYSSTTVTKPVYFDPNGSGKGLVTVDTVPLYVYESTTDSLYRPDVVVDSLYTYPTNPKAGDYVFFYARLKNIGNATLNANVGNAVKFQVDGVTKATYNDSRAIMKDSTIIVGYAPYPPPGDGSIYDWKATWGDHLIRAWVDSSDRYVELREDNNTKYIWKHFQPKVSAVINNNDKFTNHLTNNALHIVMNESTTPLPDSAKLKHQGTWTKIGVYGSRDTMVTYTGNGTKFDTVRVWQSGDTASTGDTIIVDITAPRAQITSPAHGATVSGTININGYAYDYGPTHFLVDTLRYFRNSTYHDTIHVSLVNIYGGVLGTWNTIPVPNGWTQDTLVVRDSAGNVSRDSISLNVYNKLQLRGGEGFATDFGTYPSSPMNVATDPGGNVYIAETQGSKIRKHSPRKDSLFAFTTKRGNDSTGTSWATSMTLRDSETLWIADGYNHCIKRFDRQGNLLLRFGSFGSDTSRFKQPCGIALDNKERLWVSDRLNNRIQVFDSTGHFLLQFGSQGRDSTQFDSPTGIAITRKDTLLGIVQDLVWISDTRNNRVQVYQIDTVSLVVRFFKTISQVDSSGLDTPLGICSDKWGDVFVADSRHNRIVEMNPYGERILDFGGLGDSLCQFRTPVGVASSPGAHYLYVADMGNRRVQRFTVILEDSSGGGPQSNGQVRLPPRVYFMAQSHPNPTTGEAMIEYGLPEESQVNLTIYNVAGQIVRDYNPGKQKAWYYSITWDGRSNRGHRVGAGVYFYRLMAGSWVKTRKMVVVR